MTSGPDQELLDSFRERVAANPLLAGLADGYLVAIAEARPTFAADELRTIARDFTPLLPAQVLPLWNAWRQSLRSWQETEAAARTAAAGGSAATSPAGHPDEPAPRSLSVVPPFSEPSGPPFSEPAEPSGPPFAEPAHVAAHASTPPSAPSPPSAPAPVGPPADRTPVLVDRPDLAAFNGDIDVDHDSAPLDAREHGDRVDIRWDPIEVRSDELVVYLVVGGPTPVHAPTMGSALRLTSEPGVSVASADGPNFAVFAYRGATLALARGGRCVRVGTGTAVAEVRDLASEVSPQSIRLQWTRPASAERLMVLRNRDQPVPTGYAMHLRRPIAPDADVLTDDDVEPGALYFYRITTVNADGIQSEGVTLALRVPARPKPVTDLQADTWAKDTATYTDLSWPVPPDGAEVWIYTKPTSLLPSIPREQLAVADLRRLDLGTRALGHPVVDGERVKLERVHFPEDESRQFYTPVSVIGDVAIIGTTVAASSVSAVANVEIVDRVHWQLVRFDWPSGATFVDIATAHLGQEPMWANRVRVTRDRYDRDGGGLFGVHSPLDVRGRDVVIRGVNRYSGKESSGPEVRVRYQGRWVVSYQLFRPGRVGGGRRRTLEVTSHFPEARWPSPPVRVRVLHHPSLLPMSPSQAQVRQLPIHLADGDEGRVAVELPQGALPSGTPLTIGQVELPDGYVRVVVDALDPSVPVVVLDPPPPALLATSRRATPRLPANRFRCRSCLGGAERFPQVFECQNPQCPGRTPQSPFRFTPIVPPLPPGARRPTAPPARAGDTCPRCQVHTSREICRECLAPVPAGWFDVEPFPMAMAGAKTTGKSVYAYVALSQLRDRVARDMRGTVTEYDADTARRIGELRELFRGRMLPVSTGGEDGWDPLTFTVSGPADAGRHRALMLYDLSGDWVQDRGTIENYRNQLGRAGGIVFLVDVMQVPEVVDYLQGDVVTLAYEDLQDPLNALNNVIAVIRQRLQLRPDRRIEVPIAIAVSKLDALHLLVGKSKHGGGPEAATNIRQGYALTRDPYGGGTESPLYDPADGWWVHHETRSLLTSLGAGRLIELVEQNFTNFRFFGVSALGHSPAPGQRGVAGFAPFRVDEPFRWLLAEQW